MFRLAQRRCTGPLAAGQHLFAHLARDRQAAEQLAQEHESACRVERDRRARVAEDGPFFSHDCRLFTSPRSVLALPRMTGIPSREACCMNSASGTPAIFAARPSDTLSLRYRSVAMASRTPGSPSSPSSLKWTMTASGWSRFMTTTGALRAMRRASEGLFLSWRTLTVFMRWLRDAGTLYGKGAARDGVRRRAR